MNKLVLLEIFSEDNLNLHLLHMKSFAGRYSILEKSIPRLAGIPINEIYRLGLKKDELDDALEFFSCHEAHKIFFDSFAHLTKKCENVKKHFGSDEKFLYEVFECARSGSYGFVFVYLDKRSKPQIEFTASRDGFTRYSPILALDVFEHAYFWDYGFEKERYLRAAISRFDIEKLEMALTLG